MRVGLIGFGRVAEAAHVPAWQRIQGVEIVAVADVAPARRSAAAALVPGAHVYETGDELLRDRQVSGIDVLDICSPPDSHAAFITAACECGIARIVCEKPLTIGESEFTRIAPMRALTGARIVSVNTWVHSDLHRLVSDALAQRLIGRVTSVTLRTLRPDCALGTDCWEPRWRTDAAYAGGGIMLDHGWHQLYLMLSWIGTNIEHVRAVARTVDPSHAPVEDEATLDLLFRDGHGPRRWLTGGRKVHGRIDLSWAAPERRNEGVIEGTAGRIDILDDRILIERYGRREERLYSSRLSASTYHPDWFEVMFRSAVLAESGAEADRNFAEAGYLTSILAAAYRSAEGAGQPRRPSPVRPSPVTSGHRRRPRPPVHLRRAG